MKHQVSSGYRKSFITCLISAILSNLWKPDNLLIERHTNTHRCEVMEWQERWSCIPKLIRTGTSDGFILATFMHFQVIWAFTRRCHKPQRDKHSLIWADDRWVTEVPFWMNCSTGVFCDVTPRKCKHLHVFTRDCQLGFVGLWWRYHDPSHTCGVNWSRGNSWRENTCHCIKVNIKGHIAKLPGKMLTEMGNKSLQRDDFPLFGMHTETPSTPLLGQGCFVVQWCIYTY